MRFIVCSVILALLMIWCSPAFCQPSVGDVTAGGMINSGADTFEGRAGLVVDPFWEIGLYGDYFLKDPSHEWGMGMYAKYLVNPEATLPLGGFIPPLATWLNLPDTIAATTYLIGKGGVLPIEEGGIDGKLGVGAGASAGPFCMEFIYNVIESGEADVPQLSSGAELSFGLRWEFR